MGADSNLRHFDFLVGCPTDLEAKTCAWTWFILLVFKENNILIASSKCFFVDSENGQLSQETWTFLHDIYEGGPVLFYEGEKDNEEKQDLKDEEEDIQQEWNS